MVAVEEWVLEEMTDVITIEVEQQQESTTPKWMCPLKNPVLMDMCVSYIKEPCTVRCVHGNHHR